MRFTIPLALFMLFFAPSARADAPAVVESSPRVELRLEFGWLDELSILGAEIGVRAIGPLWLRGGGSLGLVGGSVSGGANLLLRGGWAPGASVAMGLASAKGTPVTLELRPLEFTRPLGRAFFFFGAGVDVGLGGGTWCYYACDAHSNKGFVSPDLRVGFGGRL
jgi:hypothetical protein